MRSFEGFRTIVKKTVKQLSEVHQDRSKDTIIERGSEGTMVILGLVKAFELSKDQFFTLSLSQSEKIADHPRLNEEIIGHIGGVTEKVGALASQVTALSNEWRQKYYKSRWVDHPTTTCNDNGCTTTNHRTKIDYWEEPEEFTGRGIDHTVLEAWSNYVQNAASQWNHLTERYPQTPTFTTQESPYELNIEQISAQDPDMLRLIGFGTALTGYALYEELAAKITDAKQLSSNDIKRRTMLKWLGFWGAMSAVDSMRFTSLQDNQKAFASSQEFMNHILNTTSTDPEDSYTMYMGRTYQEEAQAYNTIEDMLNPIILADTSGAEASSQMREHMNQILESLNDLHEEQTHVFPDGSISHDVGIAMRSVYIDDAIRRYIGERNLVVYTAGLTQVLTLAASLSGAALGTEAIVALSNKIGNK